MTETVANTEVIAKATQEVTNETMSLAQWLYGRTRDED